MTVYIVKRGNEPWRGISLISENKDFAEGFTAGLNHCSKRHWHRVEEFEPLPKGAPVRYWPGVRNGPGRESEISFDGLHQMGRTPGQYVTGIGFVAMTHIEEIKENQE